MAFPNQCDARNQAGEHCAYTVHAGAHTFEPIRSAAQQTLDRTHAAILATVHRLTGHQMTPAEVAGWAAIESLPDTMREQLFERLEGKCPPPSTTPTDTDAAN